MDILDIDEALKDDSFIFLEDKTHDDVSNILQQWKSHSIQQQQQQQEQVYKLNSRTFTRPKRKLVQNLESKITNPQQCKGSPMLNLEIGGLVTTMQKSFLQDTSPPASICSSMEVSIDRMNTSLITSADFINVNFLQSGSGHNFVSDHLSTGFHFPNDAYTLSDMIRDRKALESLTLSGDGTLIKDCNIGQIDDISITLSKTASSCSTMDNSTESVEANNRTVESFRETKCVHEPHVLKANNEGLLNKTIVLSDEMIGDTTLNLVENSIYSKKPSDEVFDMARNSNKAEDVDSKLTSTNETFNKLTLLDETISLNKNNCTFDCQSHTPDTNCETPETDTDKNAFSMKFCESTPQASGISHNKQQYTPSTKIVNDINISPIAAPTARLSATRVLSQTFECDPILKVNEKDKISSAAVLETMPQEFLENASNSNATFNRSFSKLKQSEALVAMQNVMNLAQAEADILAENEDEEEFEQMLDEFSKIELSAEQLKMKRSLDSIKKRFTYGLTEKHERELSREAKDMQEILKTCAEEQNDLQRSDVNIETNATVIITGNDLKHLRDTMTILKQEKEMNTSLPNTSNGEHKRDFKKTILNAKESPNDPNISPSTGFLPSTLSSGNGAERLLSRRSRLYDDINLTTVSAPTRSPATSCKLLSNDKDMVREAAGTMAKSDVILQKSKTSGCERMVGSSEIVTVTTNDSSKTLENNARRLLEKRERDRDRFKTVEIVRKRTTDLGEENYERLNVPCIDDMLVDHPDETADVYTEMVQPLRRFSRRDHTLPQSNDTQSNVDKERTATNINYLTYKKPKEKKAGRSLREIISTEEPSSIVAHNRLEPRSLSRPRYISGLQKFSVVSKATSAGDLEKTAERSGPGKQSNLPMNSAGISTSKFSVNTFNFNRTQPNMTDASRVEKELKSPMGIKSKSFHNLSSNLGGGGGLSTQKTNLYGLRTKTSNTARVLTEKPKCDETVFKVPKLVSGIRVPSGIKRAGLVRPSSGYYSLNVPASAKSAPQPVDIDIDADRHSPTDSISSASSHNSVQSSASGLKPLSSVPTSVVSEYQLPTAPTKINTGGTGIPKPSGLRPPSNIKRSALPRPASILKR